uniref:Uncharacterized protein n=1 Tax=Plectus sambesii TaxID=2011161 RepID=A0A914XHV8_9BILA
VMQVESAWGPLITAGIFAATLSSALASLVSAPKVFQAVCKDRLFPYITYFAKGYGKDDEPRRAYGLGFGVAMLMILIGDLNAIAPIISNFFLASYTLINYACFHASFANSPGFRPGFKYFNMWVSLGGAVLCLSVMFIISWSTALITFLFFAMLLKFISHRKPKVNWGSSTQAQYYKSALNGMLKLATIEEHVKNYRPQVLVLSGNPVARTTLVDFVRNITKGSSLMICGHVVPNIPNDQALSYMRNVDEQMNEWLRRRRVKAFYVSTVNQSLRAGVRTLLQVAGLGKLRPNIVFMGFKADWTTCGPEGISDINEYFGVILDSFDSNMGMAILSNAGGGLDLSEMMKRHKVGDTKRLKLPDVNEPEITSANVKWNEEIINESTSSNPQSSLLGSTSNKDVSDAAANEYTSSFMESVVEDGAENEKASVAPADSFYVVVDDVSPKVSNEMDLQSVTDEPARRSQRPTAVQRDVFASINRFNRSKAKSTAATIDVWWLYDDGGLTLLIPHLLALPKSYLAVVLLIIFMKGEYRYFAFCQIV